MATVLGSADTNIYILHKGPLDSTYIDNCWKEFCSTGKERNGMVTKGEIKELNEWFLFLR